VRVVLIDGLSRGIAAGLPAFSRLCSAGLELELDTGFPTVSLPVQHVLWTGAWQGQSGVQFIVKGLDRPPLAGLPEAVRERGGVARAVVESHGEIASSFAFDPVEVTHGALEQSALSGVRSSAALVLVHILAVDDAGHRQGGSGSPAYLSAAMRADALLDRLTGAAGKEQTIAVLSDHGHLARPAGGHGGAELEIRLVRACIAGPGLSPGGKVEGTMPDLTNLIARQLRVAPPLHSQGSPVPRILAGDSPALAPLPPIRPWAVAAAAALITPLLLAWVWMIRRSSAVSLLLAAASLPWGAAMAFLLLWFMDGAPSLSKAVVFRAHPPGLFWPLLPAFLFPALQHWVMASRRSRFFVSYPPLLLLPWIAAPPLAGLVLSGFPLALPPLLPRITALSSVLLLLTQISLISLAGAVLIGAVRGLAARRE
jgi:hypothetical protein